MSKWLEIDKFLKNNRDNTYKECSEILGVSYQRLIDRARTIGLKKFSHISWEEKVLQDIRDNYSKRGGVYFSEKYSLPLTAVYKKAQELGVKYVPEDSYIDNQGYRVVYLSNERDDTNNRPRQFEHRLVMEHHLGRELLSEELVHHANEDKLDNQIDNLVLTTRKEHINTHRKALYSSR